MMTGGWIWLFVGAFLMFLELATTGFVIFFFGLSAATVGLLRFAVGEAFGPTGQLIVFSVLTVVYLALLRRHFRRLFSGDVAVTKTDFSHDYVGRRGCVTEAIAPGLPGRVELGDAAWTAEADRPLAVGTNVRVISQNNLTMKVEEI